MIVDSHDPWLSMASVLCCCMISHGIRGHVWPLSPVDTVTEEDTEDGATGSKRSLRTVLESVEGGTDLKP